MNNLPAIGPHIDKRPGGKKTASPTVHYIPNDERTVWKRIYRSLRESEDSQFPVREGTRSVDPFFGRFGFRYHPVHHTGNYFHLGIDIYGTRRKHVYPLYHGTLEYAGYGAINGKYVFLSHPQIKTEDGFVLHTLYMHLSRLDVGFNSYQKMLREISFHTYPTIPVPPSTSLGRIGSSGLPEHTPPHLHFQVEFRKDDMAVAIDPLLLFGRQPRQKKNRTQGLTYEAFPAFYREHKKELSAWRALWKRHITKEGQTKLIE